MVKKIFCALLAALMLLGSCGSLFASHHDKEQAIRYEASQRGMNLLTSAQLNDIAAKRVGSNVRLKDIELENKAKKYPDGTGFRPVYDIECVSNGREYDIDIDAVTGEILKFKLDD